MNWNYQSSQIIKVPFIYPKITLLVSSTTFLYKNNKQKSMKQVQMDIINTKYFEAFNFYFSKPTNEMIVNIDTPHVILFKDYLYYDDINEFFKRPYSEGESKAKMKQLIDFYKKEDNVFPNLCQIEQNRIISKRCHNIYKYYDRVERGIEADQSETEEKPDSKDDVSVQGSRVLTSNFQEQLLKSKFDDQYEGSQHCNYQYQYESFETISFDIFNPDYSGYSSFGDSLEKHAKHFSINSQMSSKLELILNTSQLSIQSNDKSDLMLLQALISTTDEKIKRQSRGKIVITSNKNFKKTKSPQRKPRKKTTKKTSKDESEKKRRKFKHQFKSATSVAIMKNIQKLKAAKKSKTKSETAAEMKMKLLNLKVKMGLFKQQNAKKKRKISRKQRPQSTHRFSKDKHHKNIIVSKPENRLNFRVLLKESQKQKKLAKRKLSKKRYIPTPIPRLPSKPKKKVYSSGKKKTQRNSVRSKEKPKKLVRKKFGSQHKGQFTQRQIRSPKEILMSSHNQSVKFSTFLKRYKRKIQQKNNTNTNTPQRDYNFKLNLNNLRQKIYSDKNPISLEDFAKKAGFWSSRSQKSYLHVKKKKKERKQKAKQISKFYAKKTLKSSRAKKKTISPYKRHSNALTQSQPNLIGLKRNKKGKRRSQENIKVQRSKSKRQTAQQCHTEPASLTSQSIGHNFKFKSSRIRVSQDNLQKTRELIEKFKEKVKQKETQKDAYYFYQQ